VASWYSHHAGDELVDVLFTVTPGTSLHVRVSLLFEALEGGVELEGPEEVVGLLELVTNGPDLVDEVLNAGNTVLAELTINDGVVIDSNAGTVNLTVTTAVAELSDGGAGGEAVGDKGVNCADHVPGGSVELDEGAVVELSKSEELHDLLLLGGKLVDTSDSDHEGDLGLGLNEEGTGLLGVTLVLDESKISGGVLLVVLLGVLKSDGALGRLVGLLGLAGGNEGGEELSVTGSLLGEVLRDNGSGLLLGEDFLGKLGNPKTTSS